MQTLEELTSYIEVNGLETSRYFSEKETISAIIGHNEADGALVYDYDKLVESFMEHFRTPDENKTEEELYDEAVDWVNYNTLRSLPYKEDGLVNPIVIYGCEEWDDFCDTHRVTDYKFDVKKTTEECIQWVRDWFEKNGKDCNAILGISGGKDSTICAAILKEALGADKVIGVAMPDYGQGINEADEICEYLGIKYIYAPINGITSGFGRMWQPFGDEDFQWSKQAEQNIPPRIRMTMLYALAQTMNGRVCCCDNASENYIGYSTFGGDDLGAFAPLGNLTVTEVREIGKYLGIPDKWVMKTPSDGLPNSDDDEVKNGFTYVVLDKYIREGICEDEGIKAKIDRMHRNTQFKRDIIKVPAYEYIRL